MIETIVLAALCILIYYPTINYLLIVDDIRYAGSIQNGMFAGKFTWHQLLARLYGVGTFAELRKCPTCKGARNIPAIDAGKRTEIPCYQCKGVGKAWQFSTHVEHAFTLLMHLATVLLIYAAFKSFAAALLYALHPMALGTSVWLNGRRYAVNQIIVLLMILIGPWSLPLYFVTPFFQVNAIFAPVVFGPAGVLVSLVVMAFAWKSIIKPKVDARMKSITNDDMTKFTPKRLIIIIKTFGYYIVRMIVPVRTMMVQPFLAEWGMTTRGNKLAYAIDGWFVAGVLAAAGAVVGSIMLHGQDRWLLIFGALSLLQVCNVIPAVQVISDRYQNMALIIGCYFIGKVVGMPGCLILAAYYIPILKQSMVMYRDINTYYDFHGFYYPDNVIVRKFKINWMLRSNDVMGAWEEIKKGLILNPNDFSMLYQAAVCMSQMGDAKMFEHYLKRAEENHYIGQEKFWTEHLAGLRAEHKKSIQRRAGVSMPPVEFAKRKK